MRCIAAVLARDEADRYLSEVLAQTLALCDKTVLWDDGSTDKTAELAISMGAEVWRTETSHFEADESAVRRALFAKAMAHEPDWLYVPDADELLEPKAVEGFAGLLGWDCPGFTFEFWQAWGSRDRFRIDGYWRGLQGCRLFRPSKAAWSGLPLHCGSVPPETAMHARPSGYRMIHLGYADPAGIRAKYERYMRLDPDALYCPRSHYESIIGNPVLMPWTG